MSISERLVAACLAALLLVSSSPPGHAAEPSPVELEAARKLFEEGVRREEAGDWPGALATFRKVAAVRSSAAVHFHLGLCLENTGKWVEARSEFLAAERESEGKPEGKSIAERARTHADTLKTRIPSIVLLPPGVTAPLTVTLDGQPISSALIGAEIPVDPGVHHVEARAPGYRTWTREIEIEARSIERVQVILNPAGSPGDAQGAAGGGTRFGALPWIASGVAVVGLASAGVFYGLRAREASHLEEKCSASACADSERDSYDRGRAFTTAGNVLLVTGAVAGAAAITLFVFNRDSSSPRASVAASPRGVSFSLSF